MSAHSEKILEGGRITSLSCATRGSNKDSIGPDLEYELRRCFQKPLHGLEEEGRPNVALVVEAEIFDSQ